MLTVWPLFRPHPLSHFNVDDEAIVIVEVFANQTRQTPQAVKVVCKQRLQDYDS